MFQVVESNVLCNLLSKDLPHCAFEEPASDSSVFSHVAFSGLIEHEGDDEERHGGGE